MTDQPNTPKTKNPVKTVEPVEVTGLVFQVGPAGNRDYIPFGSIQHAYLLNLRTPEEGDSVVMKDKMGREWTLADITAFPPGTTEQYLKAVLTERIRILQTTPTVPPGAPSLWMPDGQVTGVTGIT